MLVHKEIRRAYRVLQTVKPWVFVIGNPDCGSARRAEYRARRAAKANAERFRAFRITVVGNRHRDGFESLARRKFQNATGRRVIALARGDVLYEAARETFARVARRIINSRRR